VLDILRYGARYDLAFCNPVPDRVRTTLSKQKPHADCSAKDGQVVSSIIYGQRTHVAHRFKTAHARVHGAATGRANMTEEYTLASRVVQVWLGKAALLHCAI
jgi:hypothetical protein